MNAVLSFEDCPYHCSNGKLLDRNLKKMIPCPYCSEKRKELAKENVVMTDGGSLKSLSEVLGVQNDFMKPEFDYSLIVPDGERLFIEKESLERQGDISNEVFLTVSVGQQLDRSYCFGIGNKGRIDRFAYPILARAYLAGMSIYKFISCTDYNRMLVNMSYELDGIRNADFVMMLVCDGSSKADIAAAKGLMQTRALLGKATVFVTTWSIEACSILLGYFDDPSLFLATPVFVEYKSSGKNKHSKYINQLTGVENASVEENDEVQFGRPNVNKGRGILFDSLVDED